MNDIYDVARSRFISAGFNWTALTVKLAAFSIDYTFNSAHAILSQIGAPAAISLPLTGLVTSPGGYARSNNAVFQSVQPIITWKFFILYDTTGIPLDANGKLICFMDQGLSLPYITNGQDEIVVPDWASQRGWFRA